MRLIAPAGSSGSSVVTMTGPVTGGHDRAVTATLAPGVAVVIPVGDQALGLPAAVETAVSTLSEAGLAHSVIVVVDGGTESTVATADWLVRRHPGRVELVRHESDLGPQAALASGIEVALARTDHGRVLLADVDARSWAPELAGWLADAEGEHADVVLARRGRLRRRAYELLDRRVLEGEGEPGTTVPADRVATARANGARVIERRVPRARGRTPGNRWTSSLRVPWRGREGDEPGRPRPRDPVLILVTVAAGIISVLALLRVLAAGAVLTYPDSVAHLLIARRVVDAPTPGAAQVGGVWLPLSHVLAVPAAWIEPLFRSGVAGSVVSMAAFVLTARYLYRIVNELTGRRSPGVVAAASFALCPNVLYLQSTPMTELPLICGIAGTTYHLVRWTRTDRHLHLATAGAMMLLTTLVRYEAWPFCLAGLAVVAVTAWLRSTDRARRERLGVTEAHLVYFGVLALAGVAGWVLWNTVIFGDPTFFLDGEYSEASFWVRPDEKTAGSATVTLATYWYAVVDNVGLPLTVLGVAGLAVFLARTRLRGPALAAATPLVLLPFFLWVLYSGQRPLHVLEVTGDRNNVRFGLIMIVPIALLVGYLVAETGAVLTRRRLWMVSGAAVVLVGLAGVGAGQGGVATLEEARAFRAEQREQGNARAAAWLRSAYGGGTVLMNNFGDQTVAFDSGIPIRNLVYDGSFGLWEPALADPAARGIEWIYMRSGEDFPDPVWAELHDSPRLGAYTLVYEADKRRIYRLTAPPAVPAPSGRGPGR